MKKLRTLELFAGTGSFSKVMAEAGHDTFTIDSDASFNCSATADLSNLHTQEKLLNIVRAYDVIWMSPPCTTFSLASGNTHWTADRKPKTDQALLGYDLLKFCERIAEICIKHNIIFFIENPNGRAVWFLPDGWLKRVWYCQYGDTRAKPTNIWTNLDIEFKTCKNGNKACHHESAPRGSKTGTQGLKGSKERSVIPPALFKSILDRMKALHNGEEE